MGKQPILSESRESPEMSCEQDMTITKPAENMKDMKERLQVYLLKESEEEEDDYEEEIEDVQDVEEDKKGNDTKIKTYIIESNLKTAMDIRNLPPYIAIAGSNDEKLFNMKLNLGKEPEYVYIDTSDPRFWLFHSAYESMKLKKLMDIVVASNGSFLDHSWFASNFLENDCNIGHGSGFGLKYRNGFLSQPDDSAQEYLRRFSMLFWGGSPDELLKDLKKNTKISPGLTLSRTNRLYETDAGMASEQIRRNGQFTLLKGDSIETHLLAVDIIRERDMRDSYVVLRTRTG